MIDLRGCTVTIDAIGCQREIAKQVTDARGHYVLQVKDNQPTLHAKVKALLDEAILEQMTGWKGSVFEDVDAGHGRIETRRVWLTTEVKHLGADLLALWPSVKAIAAVERVREVMGKETTISTERHYYISATGAAPPSAPGRSSAGTARLSSPKSGRSRTACTTCWTAASTKTSPASARATAPRTSRACGGSPPTSCASTRPSAASAANASAAAGPTNICSRPCSAT